MCTLFGGKINIYPYLTKYSVIKACGIVEQSFKLIITEYFHDMKNIRINNYIETTLRKNSMNPSIENMQQSLSKFDHNWCKEFNKLLNAEIKAEKIKSSLKSLNKLRNTFAHGGHITASFRDVKEYFVDSCEIIEKIDYVVYAS